MAVILADAEVYFATNVLHNAEWVEADLATKTRALNNATNQLYRFYKYYNPETSPIKSEAIYEQALWLLRFDDALRKADMGVQALSVAGVSISLKNAPSYICTEAKTIIGRKVGQYAPEGRRY